MKFASCGMCSMRSAKPSSGRTTTLQIFRHLLKTANRCGRPDALPGLIGPLVSNHRLILLKPLTIHADLYGAN